MARTVRACGPAATRAADTPAEPDCAEPDQDRTGGDEITIHLDKILADRGMTLIELSERVGITVVNLSVLKNGRARAVRFSTLAALCAELGCQPGDLLSYEPSRSGYSPLTPAGARSSTAR
jgi:putative transcriptional regulator